jgi:hypothetical protein
MEHAPFVVSASHWLMPHGPEPPPCHEGRSLGSGWAPHTAYPPYSALATCAGWRFRRRRIADIVNSEPKSRNAVDTEDYLVWRTITPDYLIDLGVQPCPASASFVAL